ncbi:hypothetical protein [Nostoc sp. 'Peltigera membranacea cyanobiont' 210A]|uniref:hypothetical protein n=1 Tax=Nostoc sp. 'Peltigera membranacea cyanobiont' 210A TaxID=2014529 RepID=UPI001CB9246D|nr:hypothetical protein [Nostoc sp. 'Peltigera membranacea cyanobiont' 210A]
MKYVFHPAALSEYGEAVKFYAERRVELAQALINAVEDAIFRIIQSYHVRIISYANHSHCTPPLNPLPACGEGRQSVALAGVGFFRFNKQLSGHDITDSLGCC